MTEKEIFTAGYTEGVAICSIVGIEALKDAEFHYNVHRKKQKKRKMPPTLLKLAIKKASFRYIVVAFRYSQPDNFYLVGQVCDAITAQRLAHDETDLKGGRYTCKVIDLGQDFGDQWNCICDELGAENAISEDMLGI